MAGAGIFQGGLPLRPPVRRSHVSTESELYDKGLMLRTQLCSMIAQIQRYKPNQIHLSHPLSPFTVAGSQAKRHYCKER